MPAVKVQVLAGQASPTTAASAMGTAHVPRRVPACVGSRFSGGDPARARQGRAEPLGPSAGPRMATLALVEPKLHQSSRLPVGT